MVAFSFILISLLSLYLFYLGTGKDKRLLLYMLVWQAVVGTLTLLNLFKNHPTAFPLVMLVTVLLTAFSLKRVHKNKLNSTLLLLIHTLRIAVELVLYQLYKQSKIPLLMTFEGWNFDILVGFSALIIVLYQLISKRKLQKHRFVMWNVVGVVFLLIIVTLSILASPLPIQRLAFNQPNIAVLEFPYCFLPTCVVPIVLSAHLLLIHRQQQT